MKGKDFFKTGTLPEISLCAAFCAAVFLLSGCGNDNETATPDNDGRTALQVSSGIAVQTRAHDEAWDTGDAIGIYMLNGEAPEADNKKYTTTSTTQNGNFTAADGEAIYFPVDGSSRDFISYYPYHTSLENNLYVVDVSAQKVQKDIDLLGADKVVGKTKMDPKVKFEFRHKLVKLYLTIKPDGTSLSDKDLEGMTVTLTNQHTKATYDVLTNSDVVVDIQTATAAITLLTTADGKTSEGIVLPNADTEGMVLEFALKAGGTPFRWAVKNAKLSQSYAAGSKYKYTITIGRTAVNVTSTVNDWTVGNGGGEEGDAE